MKDDVIRELLAAMRAIARKDTKVVHVVGSTNPIIYKGEYAKIAEIAINRAEKMMKGES